MDPIVWTPASWMVVDSDERHRIELEQIIQYTFLRGNPTFGKNTFEV